MKKSRWLAVLMVITILAITGFQLYWLKENYDREKASLAVKTRVAFHQTVQELQASKLKLGALDDTAKKGRIQIFMTNDGTEKTTMKVAVKEQIVSQINVIRETLKDSLKGLGMKPDMVFLDKRFPHPDRDSMRFIKPLKDAEDDNMVYRLLYGMDSLQDSIRVREVDSSYRQTLKKENLDIPFTISKREGRLSLAGRTPDEVTIGFANPVTYKLNVGNTFPYLVKRLTLPILFSVLLLAITILSFLLLYRNVQRQKRLAAVKNEFISNITHELKTPIATVGVAIEALKNFNAIDDPGRTREYLDISSNELQRLNLLVDKVLKLSMFEKKEIELKYERMNLADVVNEVVGSMKLQLEKRSAEVNLQQHGDLTIEADRLHLQSVVFNLLDNAIKYSNGSLKIDIVLEGKDDMITMSVADNGIGIANQYLDRVFEKFFRIPHGDRHDAQGYGLGLSYAAHVIRKHRGTIKVDSEKGKGSRFIIELPKNRI